MRPSACRSCGADVTVADLLDEACSGLRLAGPRPRQQGGEHDYLATMSARMLRRLRGAGWLVRWDHPAAAAPDVLHRVALEVGAPHTRTIEEFVQWYVRTASLAIRESRTLAHRRRHAAVAKAGGDESYYARRARLAIEAGYPSFWAYRQAHGWSSGHEPKVSLRQHLANLAAS